VSAAGSAGGLDATGLLAYGVTATQLSLDQVEQVGEACLGGDFLDIREPDIVNLSVVVTGVPDNQGCADEDTLLPVCPDTL